MRDLAQANKLKRAYENMVKFEIERKKDKEIREDRKKEVVENKKSIMVRNFQQAENLRNEAKALKQARFFHQELKKMTIKEQKDSKILEYTSQLAEMNNRIEGLEQSESHMLENLQKSINEHNRLLSLSQTGGLDSKSVLESKRKFDHS